MEEQQERRNGGEKEGGQPSKNSGKTGPKPKEHRIDIVEINQHWNWFVQHAKERIQSQSQWPRIPKVPQMLRGTKGFKKFYEPRVISLGPYHHGNPHLLPGEMIKPLCAEKFVADSNQDIEALYTKIESNIRAVRNCYDEISFEYCDEELAWMMLLDGCFLLYFILCLVTKNTSKLHGLNVKDHMIAFVNQDLFLLENQLPFGVLMLIFEEAKFDDGSTMEEMTEKFVTDTAWPEKFATDTAWPEGRKSKIQIGPHLLHIFRSAFLGGSENCIKKEPQRQQGDRKSFRHIMELKAAGIRFKRSTTFLTDISFKSDFFWGYLTLPLIIIDGSTKLLFLNIVAYEMCLDGPGDHRFTSYMRFLDNLIDHADDVKELRSKHILYNGLSSDEEVVQTLNEIYTDWVDLDAYEEVRTSIQTHYDRRVNAWIAEALHDHFRSPWTFMALIAAVWMLILTGLQTYYAHPGKHIIHIYIMSLGLDK
ncbi:hypothetical protein PVL29_018534 [Vitis rotundifolia]|uniref:Uncharacterized protein n=1 Tax=Vitis rotundifolia TaxID=103349 RepID=A0AA39DG18_VITRO|nr:hypothetical protein PVL29_018534 [Vitis rotundifolia]